MKQLLNKLGQPQQSKNHKIQLLEQSLVGIAELQTDDDCRNGLI